MVDVFDLVSWFVNSWDDGQIGRLFEILLDLTTSVVTARDEICELPSLSKHSKRDSQKATQPMLFVFSYGERDNYFDTV